ncbi:MAG: MYXO-CTERM sorting domain-containing protein [Phycisphaerales bacterium]
MNRNLITFVLAAATTSVLASRASAVDLPFSTGFESSQGYTNGSQLFANANWNDDGQDSSGWTVTNSTVSGSGAASGSQWVLATAPVNTTGRIQWAVAPVTDFSTRPIITGSADVKLVSPASGTLNRTTSASVSAYNADLFMIASLSLIVDSQNTFGFGANHMLLQFFDRGASRMVYDIGSTPDLNHYYTLGLILDYSTGTYRGTVNGTLLSYVGSLAGATDFHDFDMSVEGRTNTTGGQRARAGFDNFSITQTPTPGAAALAGLAGSTLLRRRKRIC